MPRSASPAGDGPSRLFIALWAQMELVPVQHPTALRAKPLPAARQRGAGSSCSAPAPRGIRRCQHSGMKEHKGCITTCSSSSTTSCPSRSLLPGLARVTDQAEGLHSSPLHRPHTESPKSQVLWEAPGKALLLHDCKHRRHVLDLKPFISLAGNYQLKKEQQRRAGCSRPKLFKAWAGLNPFSSPLPALTFSKEMLQAPERHDTAWEGKGRPSRPGAVPRSHLRSRSRPAPSRPSRGPAGTCPGQSPASVPRPTAP